MPVAARLAEYGIFAACCRHAVRLVCTFAQGNHMFKSAFAIALFLLSSHACAQAQGVPAQAGPTSAEIALRFVEALDSANWELAAKSMDGITPEQLQRTWTNWGGVRGSEKAWAGPARVEPRHDAGGQLVFDLVILPIVRTRGHMVIRLQVAKGKVQIVGLVPDHALFGPSSRWWAARPRRAKVRVGSVAWWRPARSGAPCVRTGQPRVRRRSEPERPAARVEGGWCRCQPGESRRSALAT